MANILGIYDSNQERSVTYLKRIKPLLAIVENLELNEHTQGNLSFAWAAHKKAPIEISTSHDGITAMVIGDLVNEHQGNEKNAEYIISRYRNSGSKNISGLNSYYGAFVKDIDNNISIGTGLLGNFPIYYWSNSDVLIFSTVPSLFEYHPEFRKKLSIPGLVGILLTMHLVNNQTLLEEVKRLPAFNILSWKCGKQVNLLEGPRLELTTRWFGESFDSHIEMYDDILTRNIANTTKNLTDVNQMQSGGLDTRIISGYLNQINNLNAHPFTLGNKDDIEYYCSNEISRILGLENKIVSENFSSFSKSAEKQIFTEYLSNGFNDLAWWQAIPVLQKNYSPLFTGLFGGDTMGGEAIKNGYIPEARSYAFDPLFKKINFWGLKPEIISNLIKPLDNNNLVQDIINEMRRSYDAIEGLPFQRSWLFSLLHRQRFHISSIAWRFSFGSWPYSPFSDNKLLNATAGIPASTLLKRRAQTALVNKKFPHLAQLPLDRNAANISPLISPPLTGKLQRKLRDFYYLTRTRNIKERRYYFRVHDINNPGWKSVREMVEPHRNEMSGLLDMKTLNNYLPKPDHNIPLNYGIGDASGLKIIMGFITWANKKL